MNIEEFTEYVEKINERIHEILKDDEEAFGAVWNLTKEVFEIVNNLTNKNYDFLKKCLNHGSDDC